MAFVVRELTEEEKKKSKELKELIKQAIIVYGRSGRNHIPTFKYDVLKISGLEEEQIIYEAKGE